jgi:uncharacterized protein (DUF433 family)
MFTFGLSNGIFPFMSATDLITVNPEILGGTPVFKGTRVPVKALFDYLSDNLSLDYFLESFPSVPRELAIAVLQFSRQDLEHQVAA